MSLAGAVVNLLEVQNFVRSEEKAKLGSLGVL